MIDFLSKLWINHLKLFWSKIRWCNKRKVEAYEMEEKIDTTLDASAIVSSVRSICSTVYKNFEWTMDDISQLFDSFRPCEYLYNYYIDSKNGDEKFKDDCDGFHSVIYHILTQNGLDCCLFTIVTNPMKESHTMCLLKLEGKYYLINYTSVKEYDTEDIQDIVDAYNEARSYKTEHCWNLNKYDYDKHVFTLVKEF